MTRKIAKTGLGWTVLVLLVLGMHSPLAAYRIEMTGSEISIEANQIPMRELLRRLSVDYGITVRIDPDINPLVTATFKNRELEDGLKAILKPYNSIFVWKAGAPSERSSGPTYVLDEIHIFKPGEKDRMVEIRNPSPPAKTDDDNRNEAEPTAENESQTDGEPLEETRVIIKNNKVFVPVTLGYENNQVETSLIFDTGAGSIVLHADIARQLGLEPGQVTQGEGVGGIKISTHATRLSFVQVGPHKKENLRADVIVFEGDADEDYNGLLGMNFIRGLKYTIDFNEQVIRWLK